MGLMKVVTLGQLLDIVDVTLTELMQRHSVKEDSWSFLGQSLRLLIEEDMSLIMGYNNGCGPDDNDYFSNMEVSLDFAEEEFSHPLLNDMRGKSWEICSVVGKKL